MPSARRKSRDRPPSLPRHSAVRDEAVLSPNCPTAVSAEALRTGILPMRTRVGREEIPHEGETIRVGDPDDRVMANEYGGEDTPGGSSQTPDQNEVDAIGRAYGLVEEDAGPLHCASEILARRDRHRPELKPPRRRIRR